MNSGSVIAEGEGYRLRQLRLSDAKVLEEFAEDERYWLFLADCTRTPYQVRQLVMNSVSASSRPLAREQWWAVENPASEKVIGTANLKYIGEKADRNGSIGCTLAPDFQGKGLGTRLGWALVVLAFETFNLHRVECTCAVDNDASVHIMKNTYGMVYEGIRREYRCTARGWWSSHVFSILENEYAEKVNR
ncbi:MAG: GNAT family protein [Rhodospirillaceae bacterium]|nr:GNAT family protein [Rhodospirillaceae bacterium]